MEKTQLHYLNSFRHFRNHVLLSPSLYNEARAQRAEAWGNVADSRKTSGPEFKFPDFQSSGFTFPELWTKLVPYILKEIYPKSMWTVESLLHTSKWLYLEPNPNLHKKQQLWRNTDVRVFIKRKNKNKTKSPSNYFRIWFWCLTCHFPNSNLCWEYHFRTSCEKREFFPGVSYPCPLTVWSFRWN